MSLTVEKCLQAWTNSLRQMNAKADIVFFGDSLTYYGDFSSLFPNKAVCNLGLRGDTILGLFNRVDQVALMEPKVVYLMAGINDITIYTKDEFKFRYNELVSLLMTNLPKIELVIQSMLPVNEIDFVINCNNKQVMSGNESVKSVANINGIRYLDLYTTYKPYTKNGVLLKDKTNDGIHLRSDAYDLWYNMLKQNI